MVVWRVKRPQPETAPAWSASRRGERCCGAATAGVSRGLSAPPTCIPVAAQRIAASLEHGIMVHCAKAVKVNILAVGAEGPPVRAVLEISLDAVQHNPYVYPAATRHGEVYGCVSPMCLIRWLRRLRRLRAAQRELRKCACSCRCDTEAGSHAMSASMSARRPGDFF